MTHLTQQELKYRRLLNELQEAEEIEVFFEERGNIEETVGEAQEAFALVEEWHNIRLIPDLQSAFLRFDGLSCHWRLKKGELRLSGEFSLRHLSAAMFATGEGLIHEDLDSARRALYSEFRIFDDHPRTGAGTLAALRIPHVASGIISPEVWYYDSSDGEFKLDLNYAQYLDVLPVTKGTYGWQYLYTDSDLSGSGFGSVANSMRTMLGVFPKLFPDHDYTDLQTRFEERT
ncbi:hypothetical protein [Streptomyces sp. NPDC059134]|uniref:hypothetical protein n=1 Tax=Streptomyces sp. NPDC059134 TaxID=3346738 RepID=UPI0036C41F8E